MNFQEYPYNRAHVLHALRHYLPSQAPLKDFIHHNPLHAFQFESFFDAMRDANQWFGYKTMLPLGDYRAWMNKTPDSELFLDFAIELHGLSDFKEMWKEKARSGQFENAPKPTLGTLRSAWKEGPRGGVDLDARVHPLLFRILGSFLDQGLSHRPFPFSDESNFLVALKKLDRESAFGLFKSTYARALFHDRQVDLEYLLNRVVGNESLYTHYLFDQQFMHPGWSGMVAQIEENPQGLFDQKKIRLEDLLFFELLLEIDVLEQEEGPHWLPLSQRLSSPPDPMLVPSRESEKDTVFKLFQTAYEWSIYNPVLKGMQEELHRNQGTPVSTFQALFCIDDREESFRRHLERNQPECATFGTPGFFGVDAYFRPADGQFESKICPAPLTPNKRVNETGSRKRQRDLHFSKFSHTFLGGFLLSQTLGYFSFFRLLAQLIWPTESAKTTASRHQMPENVTLEHDFSPIEMAQRVEQVLKSIGLVDDFAPLIYVVGHGASSTNNPHYAAYDCGACSGRAGSVNARLFAQWGNHPEVRFLLNQRGMHIPQETFFVGALHDTTRDEVVFFDENKLPATAMQKHLLHKAEFEKSLDDNAKERSRRFSNIPLNSSTQKAHKKVAKRALSLFEPRPELNHATNAFCVVGERKWTKNLFLDRRTFLNSYNPKCDPDGSALLNILKAAAPVCGGINLEYYFSRVDNHRLGAGTKLPHNVVGLIGVSNGIDGDLRTGLPAQMVELHDPVRLLMIVQQNKEVLESLLKSHPPTFQWFDLGWIHLIAWEETEKKWWLWHEGIWKEYRPIGPKIDSTPNWLHWSNQSRHNVGVAHLTTA